MHGGDSSIRISELDSTEERNKNPREYLSRLLVKRQSLLLGEVGQVWMLREKVTPF